MGHGDNDKGQRAEIRQLQTKGNGASKEDFVLEKNIFNNIFEKDIRRVFIYKKAERLAKALHLIAPAFIGSASLMNRMESIAIALVDAAILPPTSARTALSRELLALSSLLSIARTGSLLSPMNAELIAREAQVLLQEVAMYEEPRISFEDAPTLSEIAKHIPAQKSPAVSPVRRSPAPAAPAKSDKGHIKDTEGGHIKDRRESILSVIRNKQKASIKDISTLIRGVSEKTIQRELISLIESGILIKEGERRWSTYSLA